MDVEAGKNGEASNRKPNAIVIGAGFGGISAAGRLARAGYSVTCIEKHSTPGGRCCEIVEQGHRFDVGPSIILVPSAYREAFTAMGDDLDRHLDFLRVDPTYKIHFHDGTCLELTSDLQRMEAQLETFERGSFKNFLSLLRQGHDNLHKTLAAIAHRNFYSLFEFFSLKNGLLIWKLGVLRKHFSYVSAYFSDPRLRAAFSFQDMYIGVSPFDAPSTFSLLQYTEFCDGVWYCRGGLTRVADALAASAQAAGVRFLYSTEVERIQVSGSRVTGVTIKGEGREACGNLSENKNTLIADVVVCAADLPWAYRNLLPDAGPAAAMTKLKYTSSAIMFYWGVDKQYLQLETHNMFLAQDFKGSFDQIFQKHQLPEDPSFYVNVPSRIDPSAAPAGHDTLMVLVPCGCIQVYEASSY
jgi:phytoene desaturase (3,4-didehydrolycopene-forming)